VAKVIFVRHGESVWNEGRRLQGQSDPELSPRGQAQAACVAERLRGAGSLAAIYTSPLRRAAETAEVIGRAAGLRPRVEPDLREMGLGAWEGLTPDEICERWGDAYSLWQRDPVGNEPPGGEPMAGFGARVVAAVERLRAAHAGEALVIVSHGGAVRAYLCSVLGLGLGRMFRLALENASLTEIFLDGIGDRLTLLNDTSHLGDGAPRAAHRRP
jgi:alpha-ribazole phosphatase/probable phosphoglycerate mutase